MNKQDLISAVADSSGLSKTDATKAVEGVFDAITGALKNLVGINGNKDYLPHHRRGGTGFGGDCYPGRNWFKMSGEMLLDAANSVSGIPNLILRQAARVTCGLARLAGADGNVDGSWYGNDTVWRMCLDLNRILCYGRADGTLAEQPQRQVLALTDAIIFVSSQKGTPIVE